MLQGEELTKLISEFLEVHCPKRLGQSKRTVGNKRDMFRRLLKWLGNRELNKETLQAHIDYMDTIMQPQSRNTQLRYIKSFITFLVDKGLYESNWAYSIKNAKTTKKKIELVSPTVMEKIIIEGCKPGPNDNAMTIRQKNEMEAGMRFVLRTGLRKKEFLGLKGSDLQLDHNPPMFYVEGKGGDIEPAPITKDMVEPLRERVNRERVFKTTGSGCNRAIKRGMRVLGITNKRLTVHSLRHIYATGLLMKGVSLQQVSKLLRHSSVEITDEIYSHYTLTDLSVIANTKQDLVRLSASVDEVFDDLLYSISNSGLDNDHRFRKSVERSNNELIIRIKVA